MPLPAIAQRLARRLNRYSFLALKPWLLHVSEPAMADQWFYLQSGATEPALNMALDEALLERVSTLGRPILRFYGWSVPAASFGYFQRFQEVSSLTDLRPLIRRPTGGGLVPHRADWTYSLAFPPSHPWYRLCAVESYRVVHNWLRQAFEMFRIHTELAPAAEKKGPGQCFIGAERFDLVWNGTKLAGAAQRRTRDGLLIQGSVQPRAQDWARSTWETALRTVAPLGQPIAWAELVLEEALAGRAATLVREKYSRACYNERR